MAILTLLGVGIICRPPILTGAATYDNNLMVVPLEEFMQIFNGYKIISDINLHSLFRLEQQ